MCDEKNNNNMCDYLFFEADTKSSLRTSWYKVFCKCHMISKNNVCNGTFIALMMMITNINNNLITKQYIIIFKYKNLVMDNVKLRENQFPCLLFSLKKKKR